MERFDGPFLIVLTGLPASGKSFFATSLTMKLAPRCSSFVIVIGSDDVRTQFPVLQKGFIPETEGIVRKLTLGHVENALQEGLGVICDDLNYYRSMRHEWFSLSLRLHVPFLLIHIATPLGRCLEWNVRRGRTVPDEVIKRVHDRFDPPGLDPWDRPFFTLQDPDSAALEIPAVVEKIITALRDYVPPAEPSRAPKERSRPEELDVLSRQAVGRFYQKGLKPSDPHALASFRKGLVKEALKKGLDDNEASAFYRENLSKFFNG